MKRLSIFLVFLLLSSFGCDDPPTDGDGDADSDSDSDADGDSDSDSDCEAEPDDYMPREGSDDSWPECISDDNTYHLVDESPSSIGRIAAFEQIASELFGERDDLDSDAFLTSRVTYAQEQGLDSRVQRREDEHYPPAEDADGNEASCRDKGIPDLPQNFDRCVGPAQILPILNDAFAEGIKDNDLELNAARIEAALLWFLYVSTYKEAVTCATTERDCDSSWAYYTGGEPREGGIGISGYVRDVDMGAHNRVFDGILATRCWRDLLTGGEIGPGEEEHARALAQLDRALIRGVASVVSDRTYDVEQAEGVWREAHFIVVRILGSVLLREADARDSELAGTLEAELESASVDDADMETIRTTLEELFPCP